MLIKRFKNRKYTSGMDLQDIQQHVLNGEAVKIIESETKQDITVSVLLSIIHKSELNAYPPVELLKEILMTHGTYTGYIRANCLS